MSEDDKDDSKLITTTTPGKPLIGIVVEPAPLNAEPLGSLSTKSIEASPPNPKSRLVGFELSFYIGKRILIAVFATMILSFALVTIRSSKTGADQMLTIEYREEPNIIMAAVALYLLGVATDIDLTFPLKMLRSGSSSSSKEDD